MRKNNMKDNTYKRYGEPSRSTKRNDGGNNLHRRIKKIEIQKKRRVRVALSIYIRDKIPIILLYVLWNDDDWQRPQFKQDAEFSRIWEAIREITK